MVTVFPRLLLVVYSFAIFSLTILLLLAIHALQRSLIVALELDLGRLDQRVSKNLTISLVTWIFVIHAAVYLVFTYICDRKFNDSQPSSQYTILCYLILSIIFTIYSLFVGIDCMFSCVYLDDHQLILPFTSWIMFFLVLTRFVAIEDAKDDYRVFAKHAANSPLLLTCDKFRSSAPIES
ncbi:hypothetical protein M3Y94_01300400 [Aphelenchoides besseyi]|nr:hypothetical protein M3Y94_01300400 [Aphelenchoides besseyi]